MTTGTVIPLLSDEEMHSMSVLSFLFWDSNSPPKLPFITELPKAKFCAIYNVGMVAKNSHPPENGHLQGGFWSSESIITGNFALFVNTAEEAVLWKTGPHIPLWIALCFPGWLESLSLPSWYILGCGKPPPRSLFLLEIKSNPSWRLLQWEIL